MLTFRGAGEFVVHFFCSIQDEHVVLNLNKILSSPTAYEKTGDNVYSYIRKQHILLGKIVEFEENRRGEVIITHLPTHPTTQPPALPYNKKKLGLPMQKLDLFFVYYTNIEESIGRTSFLLKLNGFFLL